MIPIASLRRAARSAAVLVALAAVVPALAQSSESPAIAPEAAKQVTARLDADKETGRLFRMCPANAFGRAKPRPIAPSSLIETSLERCVADPTGCHDVCKAGSGDACFDLARALQANASTVPGRYAEKAFALACGFGDGAGCTNRAASIRNSPQEGDPVARTAKAAKESCQFRTFKIACRQDDPWGCAMLGQSYQRGEGVRRDASLARDTFRKACRLSPDFEACRFSRGAMGERPAARQR